MDLPIVMHQPVTLADRGRWFLITIVCALVAGGMWLALPWVRDHNDMFAPVVTPEWFANLYGLMFAIPFGLAIAFPFRVLFSTDYTWIIDENAVTVHSRFIIGQRTEIWPLGRITNVRVREDRSEDNIRYCVSVRLDRGRWHGIRCYLDRHQAYEFKSLIEDVIGRVRGRIPTR